MLSLCVILLLVNMLSVVTVCCIAPPLTPLSFYFSEDNPSVCLCSSESSSEDNLEDVADSGDETYDDHIDLEPSMYVDLVCRNIDFADR